MKIESVTGKNWILKKFNTEYLKYIKENFFLDELTSKLLAIRNIKKEELQDFLNPVIKNILPNPNLLLDMEKTAKRTISAFVNDEKIGIFGDYDVDGASSTAILGRYFNELKKDFEIYIPDRKTEGYGPALKDLKI
jgi:single-stranded-DNA-specific exonuclease